MQPNRKEMHIRSESDKVIEEKIELYSDMVYRIAYSMTSKKADAEDVYQEVFMKLYNNQKEFESQEHEKAWIIRVTVNECKMIHRKSLFRKEVELDENIGYQNEKDDYVFSCVKKLPEKYRIVIYMHYYEGYKVEEIAKILKSTTGTVKSQLSRSRAMLKDIMGGDLDE